MVESQRSVATGATAGGRRPAPRSLPVIGSRRHGLVVLAALLWVALLTVGQKVGADRLVVVPWLALGPLTASLVVAWPATAVVAGCAVAAVAFLSSAVGHDLNEPAGVIRVFGSTALAVFAVISADVRVRREKRVRAMAQIATVAQTAIQHPVPAQVGGLALASRYVSASADALVGGDLFDVVASDDGARVIVGDVRGKGLAAVHTAAAVLSAFRHTAPLPSIGLDEVARRIEDTIRPGLEPEDFVTAVLCDVHDDGRLDVVLCGHPAPLKILAGGDTEPVGMHESPPLGLGVAPKVEAATLAPGERLLLFTDGLIEARSSDGRFFDLPAEAIALAPRGTASVEALDADLSRLLGRVRLHVGGVVQDDLAVLLLQPRPPG